MGICEICAKESEKLSFSKIEGAIFKVCSSCSKYGSEIIAPVPSKKQTSYSSKNYEYEEILIDDYSKKILLGRQKKGLKQEELAKILNEKLSLIRSIETGKMRPTIKLAKKIQNFLEINIIEK